jgi:hypothetical protein
VPATLAIATVSALAAVAGLLAIRRLAGGLSTPLGWFELTATGVLWGGVSLTCRLLWHKCTAEVGERLEPIVRWAPLVSGVVLAAAILLPGSSLVGASLLVALLVGEEMWSCFGLPWSSWSIRPSGSLDEGAITHGLFDESCDQQLTRRRLPTGEESLEAWLRVRFEAGQRTATAHVGYCPPFERTPHLTVDVMSTSPARIKVDQVLPFGARLEVKLAAAAAKQDCVVLKLLAVSEAQPLRPRLAPGFFDDPTARAEVEQPIASAG